MTDRTSPASSPRDLTVQLPDGASLFASRWSPGANAPVARTPILLFHDSLGSVALWRDFPAALAARTARTVVAYDRLGFGRSSPRSGPLDREFVAEEARVSVPALRAELDLDRFVAFGHSVGGGMAVHVAATYPDACVGLITESAQAFVEDRTLAGIREAKAGFQRAEQLARLERYHGDKARWVVDAWTETWLREDFASWTLDDALPQIRCPLLAMHGEHDEFGSAVHPLRISRLAGGSARTEILPGRRHVPHREDEGCVLDLVSEFLDAIP